MQNRIVSRWFYLLVLFLFFSLFRYSEGAETWQGKVQQEVLDDAATGSADFLIYLDAQADLSGAPALGTKAEKGRFVFEKLTAVARATQGPILAELDRVGVKYKSLWVANMVAATGDAALIERLARRADVRGVFTDRMVRFEEPIGAGAPAGMRGKTAAIEWNITQVNVPSVWALGDTGQGAVVGGIDTGYDWSHPALIDQYRGWNGSTADHNYNWHDAIHTGSGGTCGLDSPVPCDDHGHGTHTMGTMVGDDLAGNQVGMAPGAKWIGCRCMDVGVGTPATYSECLQWMIAPTDTNDLNPDPLQAPDVINNSWSCPPSEGCTDPLVLQTVVDNVRAAGIVVVVSAGN